MIIALSGKAGSGKTTVSNRLVEKHGFVRISLATPLKCMVAAALEGCLDEGVVLEKNTMIPGLDMTIGRLLQFIGGAIREKRPDFFVELWQMRYENSKAQHVVVDDVRYMNELEFFRRMKAYTIHLEKIDPQTGLLSKPPEDGRDPTHSSETALDRVWNWHETWQFNDGDVEGLKKEVDELRRPDCPSSKWMEPR